MMRSQWARGREESSLITSNNGVPFTMNTMRVMEPLARSLFEKPVTLGSVPYDEEQLAVGGKRVFQSLSSFGEIIVMGGEK
jgi:hypothetical protein